MGRRARSLLLLVAGAMACGTDAEEPSVLVVGLQSGPPESAVDMVHVRATFADQTKVDEVLQYVDGQPPLYPKEFKVTGEGRLAVRIEGYTLGNGDPVLVRLADAPFVPGKTMLLRLRLEPRCLASAGAPACNPPQTCHEGRCVDGTLIADDLEPYDPHWADEGPDDCLAGGPPEVMVGTGRADYAPLEDGQTLAAELGPQLGHHLWIAARIRNLKKVGSTTTITAEQPDTKLTIPPTSFGFTLDSADGGYCKVYGLRYQLDNGSVDYRQFLGKPLDVTVEVRDVAGSVGRATRRIQVDPHVVGEN